MTTLKQNRIYVNCEFYNSENKDRPIEVTYNGSDSILDSKKRYKGSVVRFQIPFEAAAMFYYKPDPDFYTVTIRAGGIDYQEAVPYVPSANVYGTNDPFYYAVFDIQLWVDLVNLAIQRAFIAAGSPKARQPFIAYEPSTQLFKMYFTQDWLTNDVQLWMNNNLGQYFYTFRSIYYGTNPAFVTNGKSWLFPFEQQYSNSAPNYFATFNNYIAPLVDPPVRPYFPQTTVGTPQANVWFMTQQFSSLSNWFDVAKVILISDDLPFRQELYTPVTLEQQASSNSRSLSIIADYAVDDSLTTTLRSTLTYLPTAEYRWADCFPNTSLYRFTIKAYAVYKDGITRPLSMPTNSAFTVKILFEEVYTQ